MKKIIILISGNGSNLQAIIDACKSSNIDGEIVSVISNKENAYGIQRAMEAGITTKIISDDSFDSREEFDKALLSSLMEIEADLIVLAGFMKILSKKTADHFYGKIINLISKNEIYMENGNVNFKNNSHPRGYICNSYEI